MVIAFQCGEVACPDLSGPGKVSSLLETPRGDREKPLQKSHNGRYYPELDPTLQPQRIKVNLD